MAKMQVYDSDIVASNGFNLSVLLSPLIAYLGYEVRDNLVKFDKKINCKEISDMFCLELRYRTAETYCDK